MNPKFSRELKIFYISISLYNFASSIIQIFVPLYLFEKGFSLSSILLFFALTQIGRFAALPLAAGLSSLYGAKKILAASFIFQIIYFLLLRKIDYFSFYFIGSALIFGVMSAFLSLAYLVHVSKISPNDSRGRILGKISIYSAFTSAAGPLLGGFIIASRGFGSALLAAIILTIPAIVFLFLTPEVSKIRKINFNLINIRKIYPDLIANGFYNLQSFLETVVWTIFIFIIIPQYKAIGLIQTISLLVSIIGFYLIGKWTDKFNRNKILLYGSAVTAIVGILRVAGNSFAKIFAFNVAFNFAYTMERFPWVVKLQEHMDTEARTEYMAIFEVGGAAISFLGLFIFSMLAKSLALENALTIGIIVSSLSGLFVNFVRK